jgi:hypothetical protein
MIRVWTVASRAKRSSRSSRAAPSAARQFSIADRNPYGRTISPLFNRVSRLFASHGPKSESFSLAPVIRISSAGPRTMLFTSEPLFLIFAGNRSGRDPGSHPGALRQTGACTRVGTAESRQGLSKYASGQYKSRWGLRPRKQEVDAHRLKTSAKCFPLSPQRKGTGRG